MSEFSETHCQKWFESGAGWFVWRAIEWAIGVETWRKKARRLVL